MAPTYALRGIPEGLIPRAKQRAREDDTTLDAVLLRYLTTYAAHGSPQSSGGHARKLALTAERRRQIAQQAARARWHDHEPI